MFSIIEHIEYLVTRYDCVTIPAWGAFIAHYSTAGYDEQQAVMSRPRRAIGFNANVNHNDGLLAHSIMRREGLSYDQAMRFIADSVTAIRQQLMMDCEVSMGRLGYFRHNAGRYIEFVPFARSRACDMYFGLADLEISTVEALEREHQSEQSITEAPKTVVPGRRNLFARRATRVAASVAVLIGLGVILSTPVIVDRSHDMASMAPKVTAPQTQHLGVDVQQGVVPQAIEAVGRQSAFARVGNTSGKYYMVIATLRNQQELNAFKQDYAHLVPDMKILDYKGMMCVYIARSDDYSALMSLRDELPEALRDVWIYN